MIEGVFWFRSIWRDGVEEEEEERGKRGRRGREREERKKREERKTEDMCLFVLLFYICSCLCTH